MISVLLVPYFYVYTCRHNNICDYTLVIQPNIQTKYKRNCGYTVFTVAFKHIPFADFSYFKSSGALIYISAFCIYNREIISMKLNMLLYIINVY